MYLREVVKKLRILLSRREKLLMIGLVSLMTCGALMEIVGLGLLMPLVAMFTKPELLEQNRYLRMISDWPAFADRKCFLIVMCGAVIVVYALKAVSAFFITRLQSRFIAHKQYELCNRLYRTVIYSPYAFHLRHGSGELLTMMDRAVDMGTELLFPAMLVLTDAVTVFFITAALVIMMPGVMLSCAALLAVLGTLIYFPLRSLNARVGRAQAEAEQAFRQRVLEGVSGIKAAKAMHRESFFIAACDLALAHWLPLRARLIELGQLPRLILEFSAVLAAVAVFAMMSLSGMAPGTVLLSFSLLIAAMSRLLPSFSRIHYNLVRVIQNRFSFDSVFEWLNLETEVLDREAALTLNERIEVQGIDFSYPERAVPVFRDFSLTIPVRSSVAITGVTGGGKSTLADILLGLLVPQRGGVFADGRNIRENLGAWRSKIGFVPQYIHLLDDTILNNVAFGACDGTDADLARTESVLRMAQLWDFVSSLPDGLFTVIGENGVRLSGGQRQRIGIARALYGAPELLIMDEATSALDDGTERALVDALEALRGRLTIVIIAHRLSTVEKCDIRVRIEPLPEDRPLS